MASNLKLQCFEVDKRIALVNRDALDYSLKVGNIASGA